jgi:hypothetical protein
VLRTFTHACTDRIDRDVRPSERWSIALSWSGRCFVAIAIAVTSAGDAVGVRGSGREPVLAIWDALSQIEEPLRRLGNVTS